MTFLSLLISFVKGTYGFGAQILREDLETLLQQELDPLQSQHLQEEPTGNKQVLQISIQQQSRLMELYGPINDGVIFERFVKNSNVPIVIKSIVYYDNIYNEPTMVYFGKFGSQQPFSRFIYVRNMYQL